MMPENIKIINSPKFKTMLTRLKTDAEETLKRLENLDDIISKKQAEEISLNESKNETL